MRKSRSSNNPSVIPAFMHLFRVGFPYAANRHFLFDGRDAIAHSARGTISHGEKKPE
jgi:hypothetical protein